MACFLLNPPPMKFRPSSRLLQLFAALALLPAVASAHPGHDGGHDLTWDFSDGLTHPLFGVDHLLAMLAVGIWAAQMGGRARWAIPATFVGIMTLASAFGRHGLTPAGTEQMIAASVLVFGLMIAMARRLPLAVGFVLTALFAAFHGFAHGTEISVTNGLSYGIGFTLTTALLHIAGYGLGSIKLSQIDGWLKAAGMGIATVGAVMLVV